MSRPQPQEQIYTREEYRRWCAAQNGGRYERVGGHIIAMAPKRLGHIRAKSRVFNALQRAIAAAGVPCEAIADGITVETGDNHYLIVHPAKRTVIHHQRKASGGVATRILSSGELQLDPVEEFYAAA